VGNRKCLYGHMPCKKRPISGSLANKLTQHKYQFKIVHACIKHFKKEMRLVNGG